MKPPTAVREDHDPFGVVALFSGYQRFLVFVRWTSYKRPFCGNVFHRDYWTSSVRLGRGNLVGEKCGREFDDSSREWPELPMSRRIRLFFPPLSVGIWGGFTLAAILTLFIGPRDEHSWLLVFIVSAFGLVLALLWSPVQMTRVILSIRRYNQRGEIPPA